MQKEKKKFQIEKKHFSFFGGIAYCLFSVVLILNIGYVARFFAFPFIYLFGLGSYAIYIFVYIYGLILFFREKGFKIRPNNYFFGGLVIYISALMIATLIVRSTLKDASTLVMSNFSSEFNAVLKGIDGGYWKSSFINLFQANPFGGGIIGYALVGLSNTVFKTAGTWAISILVLLLGMFIIFFPTIRKIVLGNKAKAAKKAQEPRKDESMVIGNSDDIRPVSSDAIIASARSLEPVKPIVRNEVSPTPAPVINEPINVNREPSLNRNEMYSSPLSFGGSSNFSPAVYNKFRTKAPDYHPSVTPVAPAPQEPVREEIKDNSVNEQMTLNFEEKQPINEDLVKVKPEFMDPVFAPRNVAQTAPQNVVSETPIPQPVERKPIKWVPPSTALLENMENQTAIEINNSVAEERMAKINEVFENFKVGANCLSYVVGPSVTRYNIEYAHNVSVRSVDNLVKDISIRLGGVNARFEPVVEGQVYSGLEIPNAKITPVSFKEVFESLPDVKKHPLAVVFGKSIDGKCVGADFDEFPHVLVAGTTGSGKSIYNHSVVCTLISRNSPDDLKLVLIDPKQVEMSKYEGLPHLLCPIINEANLAKLTLSKLVDEMNRRYGVLKASGCSNLKQYNELLEENPSLEKMPYIVVFIDEYADLVDVCKDISQPIVSLAQKARAAGIHMLIATQRPSTNIITGVIKGNLPTRVALAVASYTDSMTILGEGGGEKLLGKGDMLVQSPLVSRVGMVRLQGCFIQNKEILRIVGYLKEHYPVNYDPNFCNLEEAAAQAAGEVIGSPEFQNSQDASEENKYKAVKEWVMASEYMSMSRIQRECAVGFNRAGKFFKRLQDEGIVGAETEGNKGCPVLVHDKFYEGSVETDIPVSSDQSEIL